MLVVGVGVSNQNCFLLFPAAFVPFWFKMEPFGHGLPVVAQARFPRMHLKKVEDS